MSPSLPPLRLMSVKIPVSHLPTSRRWYAEVFELHEELEWPDRDDVVRGVALTGLGDVLLALREHPEAAATGDFGYLNVRVPTEADLAICADHLDRLEIRHTPVMSGANGRLVGFHDPDGHQLSFYAVTAPTGVREDSIHRVRVAGSTPTTSPT